MIKSVYNKYQIFFNLLAGTLFWLAIRIIRWVDFQPDKVDYILIYSVFDFLSVCFIATILHYTSNMAYKTKSKALIGSVFIMISVLGSALWLLISSGLKFLFWPIGVDNITFQLMKKATYSNILFFVMLSVIYSLTKLRINYLKQKNAASLNNTVIEEEENKEKTYKLDYTGSVYVKLNNHTSKFVKLSSISAISSIGNYSKVIISQTESYIVLKTLKQWECELPDRYFIRIHRSHIINLEYIARIEKYSSNFHKVYLNNLSEAFEISRRNMVSLKQYQ